MKRLVKKWWIGPLLLLLVAGLAILPLLLRYHVPETVGIPQTEAIQFVRDLKIGWNLGGALDAGQAAILAALLVSTILNAGYFGPIFFRAFFLKPEAGTDLSHFREAPMSMVVPLVLTSLISLALGLQPQVFQNFIHVFLK